ncbi:MAG TPA: hypothetical protein VNT79_00235 [Phycisphaerae bacterium]|nr:hypothetical protein [Phycisphaerae bacterium]
MFELNGTFEAFVTSFFSVLNDILQALFSGMSYFLDGLTVFGGVAN